MISSTSNSKIQIATRPTVARNDSGGIGYLVPKLSLGTQVLEKLCFDLWGGLFYMVRLLWRNKVPQVRGFQNRIFGTRSAAFPLVARNDVSLIGARGLFTLLMVLVLCLPAMAQTDSTDIELIDPIKFDVKVKPDTATIGDDIEVTISVTYPDSLELTKPSTRESDDIVVKGEPEIKSKDSRGMKTDIYKYRVAAFTIGEVELPYFEFYYYDKEGNQNSRIAPIETVQIVSVLPEKAQQDTLQQPLDHRDIVPPKGLPLIWWPYAVSAGVLILLAAAYWYFFKYRVKQTEIPETPPEPPFDVAIRRLNDLDSRDLPGKGKFKQFYIELTEIIRQYIDGRFEIPAAESTTFELKKILKHPEITREQTRVILDMLARADMIKFAKHEPNTDDLPKDFSMVKDFVVETKPREIVEEEKNQEVSA